MQMIIANILPVSSDECFAIQISKLSYSRSCNTIF